MQVLYIMEPYTSFIQPPIPPLFNVINDGDSDKNNLSANPSYPNDYIAGLEINNPFNIIRIEKKNVELNELLTQIKKEFTDELTENLTEKLFCFFAKFLRMSSFLTIQKTPTGNYIADNGHFGLDCSSRRFPASLIDKSPFFNLWELSTTDHQINCLTEATTNILRLLRPSKEPAIDTERITSNSTLQFYQWFDTALSRAVSESNWIQERFLPHSKITSQIAPVKFANSKESLTLWHYYIKSLNNELEEIAQATDEDVKKIIKQLSLTVPYCGEVEAIDCLLSTPSRFRQKKVKTVSIDNGNSVECVKIYPIEIHSARFFLTYAAKKNNHHSWGHNRDRKIKITDVSKELNISFSKPTKYINELENLPNSLRVDKYHLSKVGNLKYRICNGDCRQEALSMDTPTLTNLPNLGELRWSAFTESQKKLIFELWEKIYSSLCSQEFSNVFPKLLKHKYKTTAMKGVEFDINHSDIHNLFFPHLHAAFETKIGNSLEFLPCCFVLDRFLKIFNIYCTNTENYLTTVAIREEEKRLAQLISHLALKEPQKSHEKLSHSFFIKILPRYICEIKKREIHKYFTELKQTNNEPDLSFPAKEAWIISSHHWPDSVCLYSHKFGFAGFGDSKDPELLGYRKEFQESNFNHRSSYLSEIFNIVNSCWEKNIFVIPIILEGEHSSKQGKKIRENPLTITNTGICGRSYQLRRKKIAASNKVLKNVIENHKKLTTPESNIQQNTDKKSDTEQALFSMLSLPDYLINLKFTNFSDLFCNFAKEAMIKTYCEEFAQTLQKDLNSSALQLLETPDDGDLLVKDKHRKTVLIDTLFPRQREAIAKFETWKDAGCGGIFADEPGLGKTIQGCEILIRSLIENPNQPCLVIAPHLVKSQWVEEFWKNVTNSAKNIAQKALFNAKDKFQRSKARKLLTLVNKLEGKSSPEIFLTNQKKQLIKLNAEDADRLDKLHQFFTEFNRNDIHLLSEPEDFRSLVTISQHRPLRGIIIAQFSYLEKQFDIHSPKLFAKLNPSIVIVDEAHELLTLNGDTKKLGKTTIFDYIFRKWSCPKLGLTATPLVNDIYDIIDLLMLLTNKERKFQAADHFEKQLFSLANQIIEIKRELENQFVADDTIEGKVMEEWIESRSSRISELLQKTLFSYLWIKEKMINPRIVRSTRADTESTATNEHTKKEFSIAITPTEQQNILHDAIFQQEDNSFFQLTSLVSALLVHPELVSQKENKHCHIKKDEVANRIHEISVMTENEIDAYIRKSGLLEELFLKRSVTSSKKTIADAMSHDEKAILFVAQKGQAEFIKAVAMKKFQLSKEEIFAAHSGNSRSKNEIEQFKNLKSKGIMILLPKSGGAGLNFTDCALNVLVSIGWTHKDEEQCAGRNLRGKGVKHIGTVSYPFKSAEHVRNIIRKKELFSGLLLDKTQIIQHNLKYFIQKLFSTACGVVSAQIDHCQPSENWNNVLQSIQKKILSKLPSEEDLWNLYSKLKQDTEKKLKGRIENQGVIQTGAKRPLNIEAGPNKIRRLENNNPFMHPTQPSIALPPIQGQYVSLQPSIIIPTYQQYPHYEYQGHNYPQMQYQQNNYTQNEYSFATNNTSAQSSSKQKKGGQNKNYSFDKWHQYS